MAPTNPRRLSGSHSTTVSEGLSRALHYVSITDNEAMPANADDAPPSPEGDQDDSMVQLKRALSTKTVISTGSSFASHMEAASLRSQPQHEVLRVIGLGSCGSVFEVPGTELAFKKGTSEADIWRDFCLTNTVHIAAKIVERTLLGKFPNADIPKTPMCHEYHPASDDDFWTTESLSRFPATHRSKQPLFIVDRILPLPRSTRHALIANYFEDDEKSQEAAKNNPENEDCLVRIYLGERESAQQMNEVYDSLRNFPLRLNMMEDIGLDTAELARGMAIGLAIMHWQAEVDSMDVEFVLGTSASFDTKPYNDLNAPPHVVKALTFRRRAVNLWMFDFDKATQIESTKQEVTKKLVPAFLGNDPYYPRPDVDQELWEEFCGAYLTASDAILLEKSAGARARLLPKLFLKEVARVIKENEDWNPEDNIVFGD